MKFSLRFASQPPNTRLVAAIALFCLACICHGAAGASRLAEGWWREDQNVDLLLAGNKTDLVTLARKLERSNPSSYEQALTKVIVLMRVGLEKEACTAIDQLQKVDPDKEGQDAREIFDAARRHRETEVQRYLVETYMVYLGDVDLNELFGDLLASGWTLDAIDAWLAARPPRPARGDYWLSQRVILQDRHGGDPGKFLGPLSEEIRAHPENAALALRYLDLVLCLKPETRKPDVSWIADTVHPATAFAADELAKRMKYLGQRDAAISYYQLAMNTPFTAADAAAIASAYPTAVYVPLQTMERGFHAEGWRQLANLLLAAGRKEEAQQAMEKATLDGKGQVVGDVRFAGEVQAATDSHKVEDAVREEEKLSADSPKYWIKRAQYYQGRGEAGSEEEAYLKAYALVPLQTGGVPSSQDLLDTRRSVLIGYDRFLVEHGRRDEATARLVQELKDAPPESHPAETAVEILAADTGPGPRSDAHEEAYWRWLAGRKKWERADGLEINLIRSFILRRPPAERDPVLTRAEKLAAGAHPTRNRALGEYLSLINLDTRAKPLLRDAARRGAPSDPDPHPAQSSMGSSMNTENWKRAEKAFPRAVAEMSSDESLNTLEDLTRIALEAGDKDGAMRVWKIGANMDPAYLNLKSMNALVQAGLRDKLRAYYAQFAAKLPTSTVPPRALKALAEMKDR